MTGIVVGLIACILVLFSIHATNAGACESYDDGPTQLIFYAQGPQLRTNGLSPAFPSYLDFQGLRLQINASGLLQVVELANRNIVLSLGSSNQNCVLGNSSCQFGIQYDGNLILRYPATNTVWASWTYNYYGARMLFQTSPPYLSVIASNCSVLWTAGTAAKPRSTPVRGATINTTMISVKSIPANKWRAQFGINTHISQGWSPDAVYNMATYLGAGIIRDSVPPSSKYPSFQKMNAAGIKLNVIAHGTANISGIITQVGNFTSFVAAVPGMLIQIEGFNEINNFQFTYNGISPSTTSAGMYQAMKDLYSLVKSSAVLKSIPVLDMTGQDFSDGPSLGSNNFTGRADLGNLHSYAFKGQQSVCIANTKNQFLQGVGNIYVGWKDLSSFSMTETGYHTDQYKPQSFPEGVTESAAGILSVNTILEGLKNGMRQTFVYEALDEQWSGPDTEQSHFGLFRHDLTPKPSARAFHFLSSLLNDSKTASPKSVQFGFSNLPISADYLLFHRNDNTNWIVIWNTAPVYYPPTQSDIQIPPVSVTLNVGGTYNFSVWDIYSVTANDTLPLKPISTSTGKSVTFSMGAQARVISF